MLNIKKYYFGIFKVLLCTTVLLSSFSFSACDKEDDNNSGTLLIINDSLKNISLTYGVTYYSVPFTAKTAWTASVTSGSEWFKIGSGNGSSSASGTGGAVNLGFVMTENTSASDRTASFIITCGSETFTISVVQKATTVITLSESDVEDLDKYYKPAEFSNMDMLKSSSKWSWVRSKQSAHFVVFWEAGFGDDPNGSSVLSSMRVDIDDLLAKAEQFYTTNVETLKMCEVGNGKSYLDKYKMEIYLLYQTDWLATGSGYDNVIGALWVNPSTCQPVGSTIAHEIGHSFQYQVYCDMSLQGLTTGDTDALRTYGYRYGQKGSNGGNGYWEQCAQWQSYQDYPDQALNNYHFSVWLSNCHRHFEHEWQRYASYYFQYYITQLYGIEVFGKLWQKSKYPDDAVQTYMQLYCNNDYQTLAKDLFAYAQHAATFDFDALNSYSPSYQGQYKSQFYKNTDGSYQIAYAYCPQPTGFNVVALSVPDAGTSVSIDFKGLSSGAALNAKDPGSVIDGDGKTVSTVTAYNSNYNSKAGYDCEGKEGWRYGFVAYCSGNKRVYGQMYSDKEGTAVFTVPDNCEALYFVVQGCPTEYFFSPWDEDETTDIQLPYTIKMNGVSFYGSYDIDETKSVSDYLVSKTFTCDASVTDYLLGSYSLKSEGGLAQAFLMQISDMSGISSTPSYGTTGAPAEGKIVMGLKADDGTISYSYTANAGFWIAATGSTPLAYGTAPVFVEFDASAMTFSYGHKNGITVKGTSYKCCPVLVYTKDGVQYTASFNLTLQF